MKTNEIYTSELEGIEQPVAADRSRAMWKALNEGCDNTKSQKKNGMVTYHYYTFRSSDDLPTFSTISNDILHEIRIRVLA